MEKYLRILLASMAVLALSLAGCGGGGSSSRSVVNNDRDGDGIPNAEDAFPDDAARFADYARRDLVVPGGVFSVALAVNDAANPLIVGTADQGTGLLRGVTWTLDAATGNPASAIPLNALAGNAYNAAFALNDQGVIVGESAKGSDFVPVFWAAGALDPTELSLIRTTVIEGAPGEPPTTVVTTLGSAGAAYGINGAGQIAGEIRRADGTLMAALWNGTTAEPVELASLGGTSAAAYFISDGGWVVGESATAGGAMRATLWTVDAAGVPGAPVDLGTLPGHLKSIALGVDNEGRVAGESEESDGTVHAVLWLPATGGYVISPLGSGLSAQAINDSDRVAGHRGTASLATVWDARNLNLPDDVLAGAGFSQAYGLNQGSMVVGIAGDQGFVALPQ